MAQETITIQIQMSKTEEITYQPDRKYHGDKRLTEIAKADIARIKNYELNPDDLFLVRSDFRSGYDIELVDVEENRDEE